MEIRKVLEVVHLPEAGLFAFILEGDIAMSGFFAGYLKIQSFSQWKLDASRFPNAEAPIEEFRLTFTELTTYAQGKYPQYQFPDIT